MPNLPDIQDNLQDELQDLITCMYCTHLYLKYCVPHHITHTPKLHAIIS